ncbi:MAG: dihydropteroate synthase-like protein [Promethearchaeota archaeon]
MANTLNKLKILLITGKKSFNEINTVANRVNANKTLKIECNVKIAPVSVSAFITGKHIERIWNVLKDHEQREYNFILISGFIPWDASFLSDELGIPVYKGTRFSGDLFDLLLNVREIKLSAKKSADSLLKNRSQNKIEEYTKKIIKKYNENNSEFAENHGKILEFKSLSGIKKYIGSDIPPLLFAEIINAPKFSIEEILQKVTHYVQSGADVIDIGTIFKEDNSEFIRRIIPIIRETFSKKEILLSIDSLDLNEIIAGIESGVNFILSIDGDNINNFLDYAMRKKKGDIKNMKNIGIVLIPLVAPNHKNIDDPDGKIDLLLNMAEKLTAYGFKNLIYDPLLKTPINPGFVNSLYNYILLDQRLNKIVSLKFPLFMGFHNVFELIDADSSGINALLSLMACELNCGGVLTTEFSAKSLGAISETKRAINLAFLSKISNSPPINLGIDAFFSKNKRKSLKLTEIAEIIIDTTDLKKNKGTNKVINSKLETENGFIHDKTGYFKIYANHQENLIEVLFLPFEDTKKKLLIEGPKTVLIKGRNAETLYKTLIKLNIVTELSHAFYLGKELARTEYALKINASYFEDIE